MFKITKEFKWEAAHRLSDGYVGKCASIHGHSYRAQVTLAGLNLDEAGMLMDFSDLKFVKKWINDYWDHALILWQDDPLRMVLVNADRNHELDVQKTYLMAEQPTAENLAFVLYTHIVWVLPPGKAWDSVNSVKVRVWETVTCSATYWEES